MGWWLHLCNFSIDAVHDDAHWGRAGGCQEEQKGAESLGGAVQSCSSQVCPSNQEFGGSRIRPLSDRWPLAAGATQEEAKLEAAAAAAAVTAASKLRDTLLMRLSDALAARYGEPSAAVVAEPVAEPKVVKELMAEAAEAEADSAEAEALAAEAEPRAAEAEAEAELEAEAVMEPESEWEGDGSEDREEKDAPPPPSILKLAVLRWQAAEPVEGMPPLPFRWRDGPDPDLASKQHWYSWNTLGQERDRAKDQALIDAEKAAAAAKKQAAMEHRVAGELCLESERWATAALELQMVLEYDPASSHDPTFGKPTRALLLRAELGALVGRGDVAFANSIFKAAAEDYEAAVAKDPKNTAGWNPAEKLKAAQSAILKKQKEEAGKLRADAEASMKVKDYEAAAKALASLAGIDPADMHRCVPSSTLGVAHLPLQPFPQCQADATRIGVGVVCRWPCPVVVFVCRPAFHDPLEQLVWRAKVGQAYDQADQLREEEQYDEAVVEFERCLQIDPEAKSGLKLAKRLEEAKSAQSKNLVFPWE